MKKIAIISDIHSNLWGLKDAIADAQKQNVDEFIFVGDYITDGFLDSEVVELVKQYGDYVVLGNREHYIFDIIAQNKKWNGRKDSKPLYTTIENLDLDSYRYLTSLKDIEQMKIEDLNILLLHGDSNLYIDEDHKEALDELIDAYDFDLCISGHTHIFHDFIYRNRWFLNPGSVGQPIGTAYSYVILELGDKIVVKKRKLFIRESYFTAFRNSAYYKANPEWGNLVIAGLYDGKIYTASFIEELRKLEKTYTTPLTGEEYNHLWDQLYQTYREKRS